MAEQRVEPCGKFHVLADDAPQHLVHVRDHVVNGEHYGLHDLFAREGEELSRQRGGALARLLYLLDVAAQRVTLPEPPHCQLAVSVNHHEQVVEVVRHAPGKPSDGLHLLRL